MGKHKNVPANCFSYKADVGSDSLPLFTICQQVLDSVFIWIHKELFIREERALAYLNSYGRTWVEETAKHLRIILPLLFQKRGEFGFSWRSPVCYRRDARKYCLIWSSSYYVSDKGGLGSGYCETLGWSLTPFMVAKRHFLNSMFGQKFNKMNKDYLLFSKPVRRKYGMEYNVAT